MSEELESKKERGKRSPSFPLNEAIGFLEAVSNNLGDSPLSREAIAQALGHKAVTGAVTPKVGTMTHFGLLDREGGVYRISPLAKRILHPLTVADRQAALAEAGRTPTLYAELLKAFTNKPIPTMLGNTLIHNFGIAQDNAADAAKVFRQTMEFCGLLRHGVLYATLAETGNGETQTDAESAAKSEGTRPKADTGSIQTSTLLAGAHQDYAIPLTKKRSAILRLPLPLDESDVARIKGWLDLMKDVLVTEQLDEDEPS